jgi:hypothetical protein
MAFTKHTIENDSWTLIGNNVSSITFQNVDQWPCYINFNSSATVPVEEIGLVYGPYQGELKKNLTDLTFKATPTHVFARAISRSVTITTETE